MARNFSKITFRQIVGPLVATQKTTHYLAREIDKVRKNQTIRIERSQNSMKYYSGSEHGHIDFLLEYIRLHLG